MLRTIEVPRIGSGGLCLVGHLSLGHVGATLEEGGVRIVSRELAALPCEEIPAPRVYLLAATSLPADRDAARDLVERLVAHDAAVVLVGETPLPGEPLTLLDLPISGWLHGEPGPSWVITLRSAWREAGARLQARIAEQRAATLRERMSELNKIGIALSSERNIQALQTMVLQTARQMTNADAGSLYIVEDGEDGKCLRFEVSQNDTLGSTSYQQFTIPLSPQSISGYVAVTRNILRIDDVYKLPPDQEFSFNASFDRLTGYRSRSMLVVPMTDHLENTVGVIQLLNAKRDYSSRLVDEHTVNEQVIPFSPESEQLLRSFASQAAVALNNKLLVDSIENLFEGFVRAAVTAIESRDPTTFGHSGRVADLTVALAQCINDTHVSPFDNLHFTQEQLTEMRYASLLHDFGKVGVREAVLIKAKKLYPDDLRVIRNRFAVARQAIIADHWQKQVDYVLRHGAPAFEEVRARFMQDLERQLSELDDVFQLVLDANEPTVLEEENRERLQRVAEGVYRDVDGQLRPLLEEPELRLLSIRRGTLDEDERREIESHVQHTYNFLIKIPWTAALKNVPIIAYAHHEKLNGSGYPQKLRSDEIPIQSKMMTISDIFDALTAWDRPYKKAVPTRSALVILGTESKRGNIDPDLLDLFTTRRVYQVLNRPGPS